VHAPSQDRAPAPPQFRLADRALIADPYAYYDDLRARDPVHEVSDGVYLLTRYADCAAALTDKRLSNRPAPFALLHPRHRETFIGADIAQNLIAFRDAPDVTAARKALATTFIAGTRHSAPVLADLARARAAALETDGPVDFVADVAMPYALHAMCRILGFPEEDAPRLKAWSAEFFYLFHAIPDRETLKRLNAQLAEFRAYTAGIVADRRTAPRDDLISRLARIDTAVVDEDALVDNVMLLAADGVENVWAGMANALMLVLRHRAEVAGHIAAGVPWSAILTECLRLESPGQYQGRIAAEAVEIGGVTLRKYAVVLVGLAAANRDPAAFPDPTAFRPGRKGARDLSFGLGGHACLGRSLVNMQMVALFEALWPHLAEITADPRPDLWDGRAGHRWLSSLPVHRRAAL
jgi:cytochrome P450